MKVKDYFAPGVYLVNVNKVEPNRQFKSLCAKGINIDIMIINFHYFCSVSTKDIPEHIRYQIALFPVSPSESLCNVVSFAISILNHMGYIKRVK